MSGVVYDATFSLDGTLLGLAGVFSPKNRVYNVTDGVITFKKSFTTITPSANMYAIYFSKDNKFVVGSTRSTTNISEYCNVVELDGAPNQQVVGKFFANNQKMKHSSYAENISNFFRNNFIALCGRFIERASLYVLSSEGIPIHILNFYNISNGGPALINNAVYTISLSPNEDIVVVGGAFSGYCLTYRNPQIGITKQKEGTTPLAVGYATKDAAAGTKATINFVKDTMLIDI